jgi:hypothetical protein
MADKDKKDNPISSLVKEGGETADATVDTIGKTGSNVITETGKVGQSAERAVTGVGTGAIKTVGKVGGAAGGLAKDATMEAATIPHDLAKSATSGKPSK